MAKMTVNNQEVNNGFKNIKMVCPLHGEYSAGIIDILGSNILSECPECSRIRDQKLKENRKNIVRETLIQKFKECNIEPEYWFKTLDDFVSYNEEQLKAKNAVSNMIKDRTGKVILLGNNGTGKTMLASIAAMQLGGKVYTMYEISAMIRQSYTVKAVKSELEIVKELASLPFLAIDELSRVKLSESELNWRSFILDKRHSRKLPTMLMDNGHFRKNCKLNGCPKCFENLLDNDILSRLRQDSVFVVMDSCPDFRKMNKHVGDLS